MATRRGILFILSAPSGAGKDTLLARLRPEQVGIKRIVTYTTRERRAGEVDGVDYHFVGVPAIKALDAAGKLLECSEYISGRFYGVPREAVEQALAAGQDVLVKPEVQGAAKIKARYPDAVTIFLAPPSQAEAIRRMRARGSETATDAEERIGAMQREFAAANSYDHIVTNRTGQLDEAVAQVTAIINTERARRN